MSVDNSEDNESLTEALPYHLGEYLMANVPGLKEYLEEWPEPNMQLDMPCVAITLGNPEFRPLAPYYLKPTPAEIAANIASVKWVTGIWDIKIGINLWAQSKEQRDDMFDSIYNALNPRINPMGLDLQLPNYFNQLCGLDFVGHTLGDSEEQAQRDEWRVTFNVLATCKAIRTRKEFVIGEIQTQVETFNTAEPIE